MAGPACPRPITGVCFPGPMGLSYLFVLSNDDTVWSWTFETGEWFTTSYCVMNPVPPYAGQSQQQQIQIPDTLAFKDWEESCWVLPPYAQIFPEVPNSQAEDKAFLPTKISMTDLFSAQQTWPL